MTFKRMEPPATRRSSRGIVSYEEARSLAAFIKAEGWAGDGKSHADRKIARAVSQAHRNSLMRYNLVPLNSEAVTTTWEDGNNWYWAIRFQGKKPNVE